MKKVLLRTAIAGSLFLVAAGAAAWFTFPWYAQSLLDDALKGKPFQVTTSGLGLPSPLGIGFRSIDVVFTTPADACNNAATTYALALNNGSISWKLQQHKGEPARERTGADDVKDLIITMKADALSIIPNPRQFDYADNNVTVIVTMQLSRKSGINFDVKPISATYAIEGATITREKLRLDGISYNVNLSAAEHWQQPLDTLHVATLSSDGQPTPVKNFTALFGSKRDPLKPCTLTLRNCSLELSEWMASTQRIEYNIKEKQTNFTLNLADIPLNALPIWSKKGGNNMLSATGRVRGCIPIEFQDSTIVVRNAQVLAEKGTAITVYNKEQKPMFAIDVAGDDFLNNLNATITLNSSDKTLSGIALRDLSATLFGGKITSTPVSFDPITKSTFFTLKLNDIKVLDRLRLLGDFKGSLNGGISGTIPLTITNNRFAIQNGSLQSKGGGKVTIKPPAKPQTTGERLFGQEKGNATYAFSEPQLQFSRSSDGKATINFALKSLQQKNSSGEMSLTSPKGTVSIWQNRLNPDIITLSDFSTGVLDGTIALQRLDYDMVKKEGETTLQVSHILIQKLLDLQGSKKIYATGYIKGNIPVKIKNEAFEILDGKLTSEQNGQIIYATSLEERAAANPALRITYEALTNMLYAQLLSSITMSADGKSLMTIQLKGTNPDFQHGRPVELNLSVQQNLGDLMRSLSISSDIEQSISDKALQKKR